MMFTKENHIEKKDVVYVYTDGSKIDDAVGYGFVLRKNGVTTQEKCFQLKPENSVFQAEIRAITKAMKVIISDRIIGEVCLHVWI